MQYWTLTFRFEFFVPILIIVVSSNVNFCLNCTLNYLKRFTTAVPTCPRRIAQKSLTTIFITHSLNFKQNLKLAEPHKSPKITFTYNVYK